LNQTLREGETREKERKGNYGAIHVPQARPIRREKSEKESGGGAACPESLFQGIKSGVRELERGGKVRK